jgi:hypothetical protein
MILYYVISYILSSRKIVEKHTHKKISGIWGKSGRKSYRILIGFSQIIPSHTHTAKTMSVIPSTLEELRKDRPIESEGKKFYLATADAPKDSNDGKSICDPECKKTHFGETCNVCMISYGQHNGHNCPVGGKGQKGNFQGLCF